MEVSYYFYMNSEKNDDIDKFLLGSLNDILDKEDEIKFKRYTETEDDESDTLDFSCKYFSVSTDLYYVQEVCNQYHIKINFCLWISIYPNGEKKFLEFIGKLLKKSKGDSILIEENDSIILERRKESLIINKYFFNGNFTKLGVPYSLGTYKNFDFHLNTKMPIEKCKSEILSIMKDSIGVQNITLFEDMDNDCEFEISSDFFNVFIDMEFNSEKDLIKKVIASFRIIYSDNECIQVQNMIDVLQSFLKRYKENCKLSVRKGYLVPDLREYTIMERKDGVIFLNEMADEKDMFSDHILNL